MPVHLNMALSPVQFFQVHCFETPLAYALMQSKLWFFTGQDIANALFGEGIAGETDGLPSPVLTPVVIVDVEDVDVEVAVVEVVDDDVAVEVVDDEVVVGCEVVEDEEVVKVDVVEDALFTE